MEDIYHVIMDSFKQKVPVLKDGRNIICNPDGGYVFNEGATQPLKGVGLVCLDRLRKDLLLLCDGTHSVEEIGQILEGEYKAPFERICALVDLLHWQDIIELKATKEKDRLEISISGDVSRYIPMHLAIELTSRCNFRCTHCYRGSGPEKDDILPLGVVRQAITDLTERGCGVIEVTGGEPLMHSEALEFLKLCCNLPYLKIVVLLTNGYFLDKEFIYELKDYIQLKKLIFSITIDSSLPDFHDNHRKFEGSWKRAVDAIELIAKERGMVRVVMNVLPENMDDIKETLLLAKSIGATIFAPNIALPFGRGAEVNWTSVEEIKLKKFQDDWKYINSKYADFLFKPPAGVEEEVNKGNCGLGHRSWTIGPSGEVRPCIMMPEGLLPLGNIRTDSVEKISINPVIPLLQRLRSPGTFPECSFCKYNNFCPYCLQRAICATQEYNSCAILKDHGLEEYINRENIGHYRCQIVTPNLLFQK